MDFIIGHGPRRDLLSVAIIYPAGLATLFLALWVLLPKFGPQLGVGGFAGVVSFFVLLVMFAQLTSGTEQVVLTSRGITPKSRLFGTTRLVERQEVRWDWLDPTPRGYIRLGFVTFRWHRPRGYLNCFQLTVTPHQARGILAHPSCPKTEIPPAVRRRLGLPIGTPPRE